MRTSMVDLVSAGFWADGLSERRPKTAYTGVVALSGAAFYGIRKGRTARRVRRCLRREQQRVDASLRAQGLPTGEHMTVWR